MKFYFEKIRLLREIQYGLLDEYAALRAEGNILSYRIGIFKKTFTLREQSVFMNSKEIKEITQQEQEILLLIDCFHTFGRRRFLEYFHIKEVNDRLKICIELKQKHNILLKVVISILRDFINGKKTAI